jgi:hypothetical protein
MPSLRLTVEFVPVEPVKLGNSVLASLWRLARASRTRAEADARSRLFANAVPTNFVSTGSSNRLHQRERSRSGEATGKPAAFFQSAGSTTAEPEFARNPVQPDKAKAKASPQNGKAEMKRDGPGMSGQIRTGVVKPFESKRDARNEEKPRKTRNFTKGSGFVSFGVFRGFPPIRASSSE